MAAELGVTSVELRDFLASRGESDVVSAASPLSLDDVAAARAHFGPGGPSAPEPGRRPTGGPPRASRVAAGWWDEADWWDDADQWGSCPERVTTSEAARLCRVRPATIRQWASRGYLTAAAWRGRSPLYDSQQLRRAQRDVAARTLKGPPLGPTVGLRGKDLDALIYGAEAATLVGVAPSTIRMWALRGRLRPVDQPGRPLFRVSDVLRAARRQR